MQNIPLLAFLTRMFSPRAKSIAPPTQLLTNVSHPEKKNVPFLSLADSFCVRKPFLNSRRRFVNVLVKK